MGTDIEDDEYDDAPISRRVVRIAEMSPIRAAGFVAPSGEFYHKDYRADEELAKGLHQKYFKTEGDASSLLHGGWLLINDEGMVHHVVPPSLKQMKTLQEIVTIVEHEVTLPDKGELEDARLYLQNIKEALARLMSE